jgi:hypothetical protein
MIITGKSMYMQLCEASQLVVFLREIEMRLLNNNTLMPKAIFMVPGALSSEERNEVCKKCSNHGFTWGEDVHTSVRIISGSQVA